MTCWVSFCLSVAGVFFFLSTAHAEKADADRPMNIEADELVHDDLKQITVFTGHVVATKGTLILRGARIEVREDPQGFQYGVITPEPGQRAYYKQKREGVNEFMEGEAEKIEYDGRLDRVTLTQRAVLRRYRGTVLNDEMSGQVITYNHLSETFRIDSQGTQSASLKPSAKGEDLAAKDVGLLGQKNRNRVRAVLTPIPQDGAKP
jgi:lipopolysaccharide export system protein LptA